VFLTHDYLCSVNLGIYLINILLRKRARRPLTLQYTVQI